MNFSSSDEIFVLVAVPLTLFNYTTSIPASLAVTHTNLGGLTQKKELSFDSPCSNDKPPHLSR